MQFILQLENYYEVIDMNQTKYLGATIESLNNSKQPERVTAAEVDPDLSNPVQQIHLLTNMEHGTQNDDDEGCLLQSSLTTFYVPPLYLCGAWQK